MYQGERKVIFIICISGRKLQTIAVRLSGKSLDNQVIDDELLVADILKMADTCS